jgi:hypothetical protein
MGCVECTVYVSMDMTPDRGWWGVALGSLRRIVSHTPQNPTVMLHRTTIDVSG